jgi:hypothetical protein
MSGAHEVHLHDPQTLYRHWEESQWNPFNIDLAADREQGPAMDDRTLVSFVLRGANASPLGASEDELRSFALGGMSRRLKLIGVTLEAT